MTFNGSIADASLVLADDLQVLVGDVAETGASVVTGTANDNVVKIQLANALTPTEHAKVITLKAAEDFAIADATGNVYDSFTSTTVQK